MKKETAKKIELIVKWTFMIGFFIIVVYATINLLIRSGVIK